ncbi:MAG: 3,4-dihydroxy-2-butanone-4-phosphate synthase [Proteobacteria bacterium]|nr:3,4-dihydroxy-2-butanone-4-phosphate synthase [Pseudomonadota bacterium]MCP4919431.1 3,4-dihydroxy-2-butanone-4-phosphate synthase [Pseudomonadota bacterium]
MVRAEVAIEDIRAGKMVILVDDEDRENEGDLTMAAEQCTAADINFMATHGRGLICLSMTQARIEKLGLPMMATNNQSPYDTAFTVSIEAREGVTTGISAADRARTIEVAIDPSKNGGDLVTPGHIFPLRAREGGVLVRTGQTEGSVDLARLAGLNHSGVICEIMKDDGTMARLGDLKVFGEQHQLHIVTIADLIQWRLRNERLVERIMDAILPIPGLGDFSCRLYRSRTPNGGLHMALWKGEIQNPALVRIQASDPVGDVFRAGSSDAAAQLDAACRQIAAEGAGLFVYMNIHGGRSEEALLSMIRGHLNPVPGDNPGPEVRANPDTGFRDFGSGAQILVDMGVRQLRLLTNNPRKIVGLEGYGLEVVERVPLQVDPTDENRGFLEARQAIGHLVEIGKNA